MIVMKFGGTSMGSADRIRIAASITAAERAKRPVAIVVSAMSKVTDLLLDTLRHAEAGDRATMDKNIAGLRERPWLIGLGMFALRSARRHPVAALLAAAHALGGRGMA